MKSIVTMTRTAKSGILLLAALFLCVFPRVSECYFALLPVWHRRPAIPGRCSSPRDGGVSIGVPLNLQLNFQNPAAYSNLFLTTFELGANANLMEINSADARQEQHTVSFSYFALGGAAQVEAVGARFRTHAL